MILTSSQRADVAELLRCAADLVLQGAGQPGGALSDAEGDDDDAYSHAFGAAYDAETAVLELAGLAGQPAIRVRAAADRWVWLLEAAALVEEGVLP